VREPKTQRLTLGRLAGFVLVAFLPFAVMALIIQQESGRQADTDAKMIAAIVLAQTEKIITQAIETASIFQPMAGASCEQSEPLLRQLAVSRPYFRVLALVRNGLIQCSSVSGSEAAQPLRQLPAALVDGNAGLSLALAARPPFSADRPVLLVLLRLPQGQGALVAVDSQYLVDLRAAASSGDRYAVNVRMGNPPLPEAGDKEAPASEWAGPDDRAIQSGMYPIVVSAHASPALLAARVGELWRNYLPFMLLASLLCCYALYRFYKCRVSLGVEMRKGIRAKEFHVVYQPMLDITTGECVGVEALLRWRHPIFGGVLPDLFISVAEECGVIVPLTRHLFSLVADDWRRSTLPAGFRLSLNIVGEHLASARILADVADLRRGFGARQPKLLLEITERKVVPGNASVLHHIRALQAQGVKLAIDDFGTGHSSLSYLEQFNVDYLKIDRGFVASIHTDAVSAPVLEMIIGLGQRLGMDLVAEGVETAAQADYLRGQGVRLAQGYFFSRPVSMDVLQIWLRTRSRECDSPVPSFS
jgi:sensor c-di-GMP phosphodiesterase-like protein